MIPVEIDRVSTDGRASIAAGARVQTVRVADTMGAAVVRSI